MHFNPYLFFAGNCADAFDFYGDVFGATAKILRYAEAPDTESFPPEMAEKVMHADIHFGESGLMGSDDPTGSHKGVSGVAVSIHVAIVDEAERLFDRLSASGTVTIPLAKTFWAERFGMLTDRFGVAWMISCDVPPVA